MFFLRQKLGFISIFLYSFVFPAIGHSATKWSPQEEPAYWKSVRSRLTSNNLLANDFWTYLESIKNNDVQAAEYLTAMHKQSDTLMSNFEKLRALSYIHVPVILISLIDSL